MRTSQLLAILALICAVVGSLAFGAWVKSGAAAIWMVLTLCAFGLVSFAIAVWKKSSGRFFE